ncbi:hypothetical protein COO72_02410 [Bifidobacterium callitrichos]|nr:hypothetical protein COO72_02410 [Bifidobacterium callitrichos]
MDDNGKRKGAILIGACVCTILLLLLEIRVTPQFTGLWAALIVLLVALAGIAAWLMTRHPDDR